MTRVSTAQMLNDFSPGKRPGGISVDAKNRLAFPFVDVMNLLTIDVDKVRLERIFVSESVGSSEFVGSSHIGLSEVQTLQRADSAVRRNRR
jgi:hypothetical protein